MLLDLSLSRQITQTHHTFHCLITALNLIFHINKVSYATFQRLPLVNNLVWVDGTKSYVMLILGIIFYSYWVKLLSFEASRSAQSVTVKIDWLWVRSPLEEIKYLFTFIFSFLRSDVSAEFRHSTRNASRTQWKGGNRMSNTRFPLPTNGTFRLFIRNYYR